MPDVLGHLVGAGHWVASENTVITTLSSKQLLGYWGDRGGSSKI